MGQWIFKSENASISSAGTTFTHGLVTASPGGVSCTPSGTFGETRIVLRSVQAAGISAGSAFVSTSNSVTVVIQAQNNGVTADVICQVYQTIIA